MSSEKCSKWLKEMFPNGQLQRISSHMKKNILVMCALFTGTFLVYFVPSYLSFVSLLFRGVSKAFLTNWVLVDVMSVGTRCENMTKQGL